MKRQITLKSSFDSLSSVRGFIRGTIKRGKFNSITIDQIVLAVDEACSNIIEHSYKMDNSKKFTIIVSVGKKMVSITIEDSGVGIVDKEITKPDFKKYIRERKEGGLGRYLIKKIMDEVIYSRKGGKNRLYMVKYYDKL